MSAEDYSKNGLFVFLRESARSGLLNPAVARSRKTAAQILLEHISAEERINLRQLDVDLLCSRIHKLEDSSIRFEALNLYNSRLKSALSDYFRWVEDPSNFVSTSDTISINSKHINKRQTTEQKALEEITLITTNKQEGIIPIPIRNDLTVFVKDLPLDLTSAEANKIVRVIKAFACGDEDE